MRRTDPPIIVRTEIDSTIDQIWAAITEWDQMVEWYFENIPDFKAEVGFKTQFLIENEGRRFTHLWEVLEVEEKRKLTCRWQFAEYQGDTTVTFEIVPLQQGSRLDVIVEILEDFPDDLPEFKTESCKGGWNYFIGDRLVNYLANETS